MDDHMPLLREIKDDFRAAKKIWLPWWGLLWIAVACLPAIWLFDHYGHLALFIPTAGSIMVLCFAVVLKRKLMRQMWFWVAMSVIAAVHAAIILSIAWTSNWVPAAVWAGAASVDLLVVLVVVDGLENLRGSA